MDKKIGLLLILAGFTGMVAQAQKRAGKEDRVKERVQLVEENEPPFRKQSVFGLKLNSDGYGLSYEAGRYVTHRITRLYMFELNEKLHPKEEKVTSQYGNNFNNSQFKWGKANNFYQFKVGYGQQRLIGGKANKNGVSVSGIYAGGLSLGMVKPYYVDVVEISTNTETKYNFQNPRPDGGINFLGASGFATGWSEVKFKPGVHAKAAMRFDYGRFYESVSAVEAGINVEYYTSDIIQMASYETELFTKQRRLFFNAYIAILFGKRK